MQNLVWVTHAYKPRGQAGRPEGGQVHPPLHSKFEARLGYVRLKKTKTNAVLVVPYAFYPSTQKRQGKVDVCKFKTSLVYQVSPNTARAPQRNSVLKNQPSQNKTTTTTKLQPIQTNKQKTKQTQTNKQTTTTTSKNIDHERLG